jgi:hypothetical protein
MPGDRGDKVRSESKAGEEKKDQDRAAAAPRKSGPSLVPHTSDGSRSLFGGDGSHRNDNYLRDRHEDRPPADAGERLKNKQGNGTGGDQLRKGTDLSKKDPDSKNEQGKGDPK